MPSDRKRILIFTAILLCCFLIFGELLFLAFQLRLFNSSNLGRRYHIKRSLTNVRQIQPWMTFAYLNVVFSLPQDYFQKQLQISNPHYPNLQILRLAKEKNVSKEELTENIKKLLINMGKH